MRFTNTRKRNFLDLPEKKQKQVLLKAAKSANKQQKKLEVRYLKLREQN